MVEPAIVRQIAIVIPVLVAGPNLAFVEQAVTICVQAAGIDFAAVGHAVLIAIDVGVVQGHMYTSEISTRDAREVIVTVPIDIRANERNRRIDCTRKRKSEDAVSAIQ